VNELLRAAPDVVCGRRGPLRSAIDCFKGLRRANTLNYLSQCVLANPICGANTKVSEFWWYRGSDVSYVLCNTETGFRLKGEDHAKAA
jgi:hypothetical protein